jgi:hypothetical protein
VGCGYVYGIIQMYIVILHAAIQIDRNVSFARICVARTHRQLDPANLRKARLRWQPRQRPRQARWRPRCSCLLALAWRRQRYFPGTLL